MHQAPKVSFPSTNFEVEIVLAISFSSCVRLLWRSGWFGDPSRTVVRCMEDLISFGSLCHYHSESLTK